jgi:predicted dehydrogenase
MKVLIIGLGSIGKKHVAVLKQISPLADIYALRSGLKQETSPDVNHIYGPGQIDLENVDFAIISNPTSEHKKTIFSLIEFGFPLFIEKPLHTSSEVNDIIELTEKNNIITYVACNLRFLDCLKLVRDNVILTGGKRLNEVNVYCGSFLPEWRPGSDFRKSYSSNPVSGGGVHLDLIHELDYIYWLFGKPYAVKRTFKNRSSLNISAYDYCNYLLDYDTFCVNVVLNYFRKDPKRTIELIFEDETWIVDLLKNQIRCMDRILYESGQKISDTYFSQMQYFLSIINNGEKTFNTVNDAYEVLKICLG